VHGSTQQELVNNVEQMVDECKALEKVEQSKSHKREKGLDNVSIILMEFK
jgi:hypothetical protein